MIPNESASNQRTDETHYDIAKIRKLLTNAFTPKDLRRFCYNHPPLQPIVDYFGPDSSHADMVDDTIEYCETRLLFPELLAAVKKVRPRQYERFAPYHCLPSTIPWWVWILGLLLIIDVGLVLFWGWCLFGVKLTPIAYLQTPFPFVGALLILALILVASRPIASKNVLCRLGAERKWPYIILAVTILAIGITCLFWPLGLVGKCCCQPDFSGKVCQIKKGWNDHSIFLRQVEFDALGLPIGTKVKVTVCNTKGTAQEVILNLDGNLEICAVRLSKHLREALKVDDDVKIEPESDRPDREFDLESTSPSTLKESTTVLGKVCMIEKGQDTNTFFLRQAEFDAFAVPAGTTVSITSILPDTQQTVDKVTLDLDSEIGICVVRLSESLREALGVNDDVKIDPESSRPDREFDIHLGH